MGDKAEKLVKSLNEGNMKNASKEIASTEEIRIVGIVSNMESGVESVAKSTMKSAVETAIETAYVIVISSSEKYEENKETITKKVYDGARVVFIRDDDQNLLNWETDNINMMHRGTYGKFFIVSNKEDGRTKGFREGDFSYLYNKNGDLIDFTIDNYIECNGMKPLIYTYAKPEFFDLVDGRKKKLTVVGSVILGKGEIIAVGMFLDGRIGCNPTLDILLRNLTNN